MSLRSKIGAIHLFRLSVHLPFPSLISMMETFLLIFRSSIYLSLTSWILPLEEGGARMASGDPCRENLDSFFNQTQSWPLIFPIRIFSAVERDSLTFNPFSTSFDVTQEQDRCHRSFSDFGSNDGMENRDLVLDPFSTSFDVTQEQDRCHSSFPDFDSNDGIETRFPISTLSVHPSMSLRSKIGAITFFLTFSTSFSNVMWFHWRCDLPERDRGNQEKEGGREEYFVFLYL